MGLGRCLCGARATTLQEGATGPARCSICADKVDAGRERIASHARALAAADRDVEKARAGCRTIVGYPIVYGQDYRMPDGTIETIEHGAARSSLAKRGITLVLDHDDRRVLAWQSDGTLRLKEDYFGVFVQADIPHSHDGREARLLVAGAEAAGSWKGRPLAYQSAPPLKRRIVRELNLIHLSLSPRSRAAYKQTWFDDDGATARRRALRCQADAIERALLEEEVAL